MKDKLLVKNTNLEKLIKKINDVVGKKFEILDEKDDIEKWNGIPKLLLLDDVAQKRLLSFVEYMDSLSVSIEDKAMIVISLSGLIEFANVKLYDYDDGSLFTMADYYQNSSIEHITKTISLIGNNDLLLAVRKKTLELDTRKNILLNIEKKYISDKIDSAKKESVSSFITDMIKELETKDYYELINK